MKQLRKNNYWQFVIRSLARFGLSALLGIVLVGESISAVPKSVGVEIAQQGITDNKEVLRVEAQRLSIEGMQLLKQGTLQSLKQAINKWEKALSLWQKVEDKKWQSSIMLGIGRIYDDLGDKQQSRKLYEQALQINRLTGDKSERATILNNLGKVHNDLGNRKEALKSYNQVLQILPLNGSIEDEAQKATTLSNIGFVYKDLGDFQQALKFYNQALPLMQIVKDKSGEAKTLNNIGGAHHSLEDKQKALEFYNQALSLSQEVKDKNAEAATLNNIGFVYKDLGDFQKALEKLNQALRLRKEIGDKSGEAITRNNLGTVYFLLGDNKQALEFYKQALPLNRLVEDKNGEAKTLHNIAKTHRDNGNLQQALTNSKAAVDIIENLRTKVDSNELRTSYFATVQDIYKLYIDILMQLHKQNPSKAYDAQALHASEKSRARGLLELLTEANADIRKGVNPELVAQEKRLQQLINSKEKLRLKTLSNKNKSDDLISKAAAQRFKNQVQNHINELNQLKAKIKTTSPKYAQLKYPQPLNLGKIQQQLDKDTVLLQYSLGEKRSYLWKVTPDSLDSYELPKSEQIETAAKKLRNLLQDPSTLSRSIEETNKAATELSKLILAPVANKLGKKRLVIVGDDALQYIPFAALADLNLQPARDSKSLANSESPLKRTKNLLVSKENTSKLLLSSVRFNGLQLLDWGLQPQAGKMLAKSSKSKSPQDNSNYQPLLINHEIVHLPSASTIDILRKETAQRPTASKTLAVLADPVFCKDYQPATGKPCNDTNIDIDIEAPQSSSRSIDFEKIDSLPHTRKEAKEILKLVSPANSLKAFDFNANYNWATQKQLSNYRYLHFATHGFVDTENPELSGIVLSLFDKQGNSQKEGFLRLHELFNLDFPAELVVLSACQTGLGKEVKGEGLVGLTRGLMYAGAERVVLSLWNVKDDSTSLLMRQFYQEMLQQGKSPSSALREAQIKMWQTQKWRNPYYWAAFTIQGEWK
ncbi:MAG: CHAT domain-containing protein [Rivularia sp. (in: Bacteria)]|nr:CHAT domain-containing protein [Rivularia sp. MS3]